MKYLISIIRGKLEYYKFKYLLIKFEKLLKQANVSRFEYLILNISYKLNLDIFVATILFKWSICNDYGGEYHFHRTNGKVVMVSDYAGVTQR